MTKLYRQVRRIALLVALPLVAVAVAAPPAHADTTTPTTSPAQLQAFRLGFLDMMSSISMVKARQAFDQAPGVTATAPIDPADVLAALQALPQVVSNLQPTNGEEASAKALLGYWTSQPDYIDAVKALVEGEAWAVDRMVTEPVAGTALLSWAVQGLLERGSLTLNTSFWGRVAVIATTVGAVAAIAVGCTATAVVGCVAAAGVVTLAGGAAGVALIKDEQDAAGQTEGSVQFLTQCQYDNVCDVSNLQFSHPTKTMVSFDTRWVTVRANGPYAEANGIAYCYLGYVTTPASSSASSTCFTRSSFTTGTNLYRSNQLWFANYTGDGYTNFVCSSSVGVDVRITWSNGKIADGVGTSNKTARSC